MVVLIFGLITTILNCIETFLTTPDGCKISVEVMIKNPKNITLFEVHGLGSSKEEWRLFNSYLEKESINYISIDLRGHGKSTNCAGKYIKYPNIEKKDIKNFINDIDTAVNYIKAKYPDIKIIPAGASIGANIVMCYFYKTADKILLLSPGINYGDYETAGFFKKTKSNIMFVVSEKDIYSLNSVRVFMKIMAERKIKNRLILSDNGHGVEIFKERNGFEYIAKILDWIKN